MEIHPIKINQDYQSAIAEISVLIDSSLDTEALDRLEVLATLVEAYEAKICPIELPSPIEAIEFALERLGWS